MSPRCLSLFKQYSRPEAIFEELVYGTRPSYLALVRLGLRTRCYLGQYSWEYSWAER